MNNMQVIAKTLVVMLTAAIVMATQAKADIMLGITPSAISKKLQKNAVATENILITKSTSSSLRIAVRTEGNLTIETEKSFIMKKEEDHKDLKITITSPDHKGNYSGKIILEAEDLSAAGIRTAIDFIVEIYIIVPGEDIIEYRIKRAYSPPSEYSDDIKIELDTENTGTVIADIPIDIKIYKNDFSKLLMTGKTSYSIGPAKKEKISISIRNTLLPGQYFAVISDKTSGFSRTIPIEILHKKDSTKTSHYVIAGSMILLMFIMMIRKRGISLKTLAPMIFILMSLQATNTGAYDVSIQSVEIEPIIYPAAGTYITVYCNATIIDYDGTGNISSINATIYNSDTAGPDDEDDNNNHYTNASCSTSSYGNTTNVSCGFLLWYYAEPGTNWYCSITADDGGSTDISSLQFKVEELQALTISEIGFSDRTGNALDLGEISEQATMNITNIGNTNISVSISGSDMSCDQGTIPVENQRYSTTDGFGYRDGTSLTDRATTVAGLTIPFRTDSVAVSYLYWLIQIPDTGVIGNCTGTISASAK